MRASAQSIVSCYWVCTVNCNCDQYNFVASVTFSFVHILKW